MIFVYIRVHSWFWIPFVYFVCFVVQPIRVHSCPFVVLFFLFVYFVCFVVQSIRVHSCPFVVLVFLFVYFVSIRGSGFSFRVFRVFRGSSHSRPFVAPRPVSAKIIQKTSRLRCFFEIICRLNHRGGVILGFSPPRITRNYVKEIYLSACLTDGVVLRHYL